MKKYILFLILISIAVSAKLFSQETKHPIDLYLDSCMEKDMSTAGIVKCMEEATKMWDAELNKYFKLLIKELDEESVYILKSAETEWLVFRDKEFQNIDNIYSKLKGTMFIPMKYDTRLDIVRTRALRIKDYYEILKEND